MTDNRTETTEGDHRRRHPMYAVDYLGRLVKKYEMMAEDYTLPAWKSAFYSAQALKYREAQFTQMKEDAEQKDAETRSDEFPTRRQLLFIGVLIASACAIALTLLALSGSF